MCAGASPKRAAASLAADVDVVEFLARRFPAVRFERYCDDVIVHAATNDRPGSCGRRSLGGWRSAGLSSASARPASCTARTPIGAALRARALHVLRVHVSSAVIPREARRPFVKLSVGDRRPRAQTHRTGHPSLAVAPLVAQHPHRPGQGDRRRSPGVDQLLRALLPLGVGPATQTDRRIPGSVGLLEVQAAAPLPRQGTQVPGCRLQTRARAVRAPARRRAPRRPDSPGEAPDGVAMRALPSKAGVRLPIRLRHTSQWRCSSDSRGRAERAVRAARRD